MERYTAASCFATSMLPHARFVRDFEDRKKAAMCCRLGWNPSLFPGVGQREQRIEIGIPRGIHRDAGEQARPTEHAKRRPGAFNDIERAQNGCVTSPGARL